MTAVNLTEMHLEDDIFPSVLQTCDTGVCLVCANEQSWAVMKVQTFGEQKQGERHTEARVLM